MIEIITLLLTLAFGVVLGAVFFGGLWLTIRLSLASSTPARWFLVGALLRTGIVLVGFWWIAMAPFDWHRLLACLIGFGLTQLSTLCFLHAPAELRKLPDPGSLQ